MVERRTGPTRRAMMSDVDQMRVNELHKLERRIGRQRAEMKALRDEAQKVGTGVERRWKRLAVEFDFEPGDLQPQRRSLHVDHGMTFFCTSLGDSLRVLAQAQYRGLAPIVGQQTQVTLGYDMIDGKQDRQQFFDYFCRIFETGTDREWQNVVFPAVFLQSGHLSPLMLPRPARIEGGSELTIEVDPIFSRNIVPDQEDSTFINVRRYKLHLFFDGWGTPA